MTDYTETMNDNLADAIDALFNAIKDQNVAMQAAWHIVCDTIESMIDADI